MIPMTHNTHTQHPTSGGSRNFSALQKPWCMQAKLEVKTKKKVITSTSHFLLAAASLPFSTAPEPTH